MQIVAMPPKIESGPLLIDEFETTYWQTPCKRAFGMSNAKMTRFTIELTNDLAIAVAKAAEANKLTVEETIGECVSQSFETALRHRALIQRQDDVDEALLELARLVGRLSAGPGEPQDSICRSCSADAE
jgi:hypothetical protein